MKELYVIKGEITLIVTSLKRSSPRWNSQQEMKTDPLLKKLNTLRESLERRKIEADANYFLVPFLDVIRSDETSGPVTAIALSSIEKFISYGIVNEINGNLGAVEAITDSVIHAHFVSTDSASDELVLLKILHVLHRLFTSPLGQLLSNESVCELMQACFRMCFIERANELLRKSAESALTDMIQLLFQRLSGFRRIRDAVIPEINHSNSNSLASPSDTEKASTTEGETSASATPEPSKESTDKLSPLPPSNKAEVIPPSIRIQEPTPEKPKKQMQPYGLPCIRELFRFLTSLINPHDKQNSEVMTNLGLKLLLVILETSVENIAKHSSLMSIVKNELSKNLIALLSKSENLIIVLRILFVIFYHLRSSLKFQFEIFLTKLFEYVGESAKSYADREIVFDTLVSVWKIPLLTTELYLNYDCDLFTSNLFEDATKLLSKNAFPMQTGINSIHLLCLDGLLSILDGIESHCTNRLTNISASSDESNSSVFYHDEEDYLPSHEKLMAVRHKKKIFHSGSEHFNTSPKKGIEYLQSNGILKEPIDYPEIANFLRENCLLDKKQIGDYISTKKNHEILKHFVRSFDFKNTRIDEALRLFLETFRLPGEAPLISHVLEEFAETWTEANGNPFVNVDAAFTLSYAVIMLNVDQHNSNVKRQGSSMTFEEFRKNLKGVNGGQDFDEEMLKGIYTTIKSQEIVMPAEQTGLLKENYLWKVLLRREAKYQVINEGAFDHDLFSLSWGPTVAALSFIFDKTINETIISKTIEGFKKTAIISAHYNMSDVFDNLIINLIKFTNLLSSNPELKDYKSQGAIRTVFTLVHRHGGNLREGWKNFIDCLVSLFRLQLLPKILTESEDFTEPSGRVSLVRRSNVSVKEGGLFSSIYSYIASTDSVKEDTEDKKIFTVVKECQPELLLSESKFLPIDSLTELVKSLIYATPPYEKNEPFDEECTVFTLELLLKIAIQNRDRALNFWEPLQQHLFNIILSSSEIPYLLERSTVGLMRLALRLMRKEDICSIVLKSLKILMYIKPTDIVNLSQQISFSLHEILKTTAANIHTNEEWSIIFSIIEYVGAGKIPETERPLSHSVSEDVLPSCSSNSDRGYTSDSEIEVNKSDKIEKTWIFVSDVKVVCTGNKALVKSCETLSFLVRDAAHITPDNFSLCVGCIRTFVEACAMRKGKTRKKKKKVVVVDVYDADESDSEEFCSGNVAVQLLDLLHTLHTRAAQIFNWWQRESHSQMSIWTTSWQPLLSSISLLCSDPRKQVRTTALTYLQRALLVPDLQTLMPKEWKDCFDSVLFPLMEKLMSETEASFDETRMRAVTLICKVFLQHLSHLLVLDCFGSIWIEILDYLQKYISFKSELLTEAIPESLKNLLLVMDTAGVFHTPEGYTEIWMKTWDKIDSFLPGLRAEFVNSLPVQEPTVAAPPLPNNNPNAIVAPQVIPILEQQQSSEENLPIVVVAESQSVAINNNDREEIDCGSAVNTNSNCIQNYSEEMTNVRSVPSSPEVVYENITAVAESPVSSPSQSPPPHKIEYTSINFDENL